MLIVCILYEVCVATFDMYWVGPQMNIELKSALCYVWLYSLALHSIVSVLSCVTVRWFCCSVLTATIIQTNIIIICPIAIAYSMDRL